MFRTKCRIEDEKRPDLRYEKAQEFYSLKKASNNNFVKIRGYRELLVPILFQLGGTIGSSTFPSFFVEFTFSLRQILKILNSRPISLKYTT